MRWGYEKVVLPDRSQKWSNPPWPKKREVELGSAVARREPKHSSKPRRAYLKSQGRADMQGFPSAVSRPEARCRRRCRCARKVFWEGRKKCTSPSSFFLECYSKKISWWNCKIVLTLNLTYRFVLCNSLCPGDQTTYLIWIHSVHLI